MWPFKKKSQKPQKVSPWEVSKIQSSVPRPQVSKEQLKKFVRHLSTTNSTHFKMYDVTLVSLFYAKAQGFEDFKVDTNNLISYLEFLDMEPETLSSVHINEATFYIGKTLEFEVQKYFDEILERSSTDEIGQIVKTLSLCLQSNSLVDLFEKHGVNFEEFFTNICFSVRERDLEKLKIQMETKKDYLKPLLERSLTSGKNKYGDQDYEKYFEELIEFCEHYFVPGSLEFFYSARQIWTRAEKIASSWFDEIQDISSDIPQDGIDFEYWCAARLGEQEWTATVSQASGDQGVDIIAVRDGMTVAIQCKRYSKPVGNSAVQEVVAGKQMYNADSACVISTGGFTSSASILAEANSTVLLSAEFIDSFSERFGFEPTKNIVNRSGQKNHTHTSFDPHNLENFLELRKPNEDEEYLVDGRKVEEDEQPENLFFFTSDNFDTIKNFILSELNLREINCLTFVEPSEPDYQAFFILDQSENLDNFDDLSMIIVALEPKNEENLTEEASEIVRRRELVINNEYLHRIAKTAHQVLQQTINTLDEDGSESIGELLQELEDNVDFELPYTLFCNKLHAMNLINFSMVGFCSEITSETRKLIQETIPETKRIRDLVNNENLEQILVYEVLEISELRGCVEEIEILASSFELEIDSDGFKTIKRYTLINRE